MSDFKVGVDFHSGSFRGARVANESGRLEIGELFTLDSPQDVNDERVPEDSSVWSVPDDEVQIKRLYIPQSGNGSVEDRVRFELAQSILEDEQEFAFDFHSTGESDRYLGFIFRRNRLRSLFETFGRTLPDSDNPIPFRVRSLALGLGYLSFCEKEDGELICLVDLTDTAASLCFVHNRSVADLAWMPLNSSDISSTEVRNRLAIDLKTVVNFRLSALMDQGIHVPLASLIVTGEAVDEQLRHALQAYFAVGVSAPRVHAGYLAESAREDPGTLERYVVALGLTVN
ncbi:MAG: hypothetical protein DRP45_04270 [Candidatus Zixiibacteriota bacterium]|nr:MAG: hypothetical protein DRP45_04270 [candidate division Zixibacteria bacterium]